MNFTLISNCISPSNQVAKQPSVMFYTIVRLISDMTTHFSIWNFNCQLYRTLLRYISIKFEPDKIDVYCASGKYQVSSHAVVYQCSLSLAFCSIRNRTKNKINSYIKMYATSIGLSARHFTIIQVLFIYNCFFQYRYDKPIHLLRFPYTCGYTNFMMTNLFTK